MVVMMRECVCVMTTTRTDNGLWQTLVSCESEKGLLCSMVESAGARQWWNFGYQSEAFRYAHQNQKTEITNDRKGLLFCSSVPIDFLKINIQKHVLRCVC